MKVNMLSNEQQTTEVTINLTLGKLERTIINSLLFTIITYEDSIKDLQSNNVTDNDDEIKWLQEQVNDCYEQIKQIQQQVNFTWLEIE